ncbi:Crp/Fnr family transcriptional regulator [Lactococcus lactis]|uniref:Crp/Fnr family transcriptional regulator n=1 Tax=Lactococcus lactis TaxID=1358 RepID=UPI0019119217|nr:Crp/Fnr family transcriptional regulator [Lactococcus lactis]MBK5077549.1 Crp/Fnr family transcriptional regulator [Lactococcus lactis]WDA67263.1 Crp/Fnr family transcriptional regulator [Lactococcus lactis]
MNIFETTIIKYPFEILKVQKGSTIKCQGDNISKVYFIREGEVSVQEETLAGDTLRLKTLKRNECFGELELFSSLDCKYNVKALTNCEIVCFSHEDVSKCMEKDFRVAKYLYQALCLKLESSSNCIVKRYTRTLYERLLSDILSNTDNGVYKFNKNDLCFKLSTTLRTLNRAFKKAQNENLICLEKGKARVLSLEKIKLCLKNK